MDVSSSAITSVDWENETLTVMFHAGTIYQYFGVPKEVFEEMTDGRCVGQYLNTRIKGAYSYARV